MSASLRFWISGLGLFGASPLDATIYDLALGDGPGRSVRMNVPDSLAEVRGLLTIYWRPPGAQTDEAVLTNDNGGENANAAEIAATADKVGAFAFAPDSRDAAMIVTLPPGVYTVHARGTDDGTGVGLLELYDLDG